MKAPRDALEGVKLAPKAVVGRVSLYLRQLESFQRQGYSTVSSNQLGEPWSIKLVFDSRSPVFDVSPLAMVQDSS